MTTLQALRVNGPLTMTELEECVTESRSIFDDVNLMLARHLAVRLPGPRFDLTVTGIAAFEVAERARREMATFTGVATCQWPYPPRRPA